MYRVTDDFYDREIASKKGGLTPDRPWLLFFVKDRFATYTKDPKHVEQMDFFMNLLWISKHSVLGDYNYGWVDVWDEGENLKETFDIDTVYTLLMLKDGKYYEMPWYPELSWNANDVAEFLDFKHNDVVGMPIRPRVDGIWLYKEYATKYLTEHHFNEIIQSAFKARNALRDYLGFDVDFKARNPLFGKK